MKEALKLALYELEGIPVYKKYGVRISNAIVAIKEALAQPVQEPVAWKWHKAPVKTSWGHEMFVADLGIDRDHTVSIYCERDQISKVEAMFTTPPAAQPAQGPHNFCPRCAKRLWGVLGQPQIHTCTPPLWGYN